MTEVVIGVDGGGTRTRVVVADLTGQALSSAEAGPSAVRSGRAAESAAVIASAVHEALNARGADVTPRALCVGVAGVGREDERSALHRELDRLALADEVIIAADAMIGLADAFGDGPGVLVVAGTGSIGYGRGPTGAFARCGGWGPVCGDEGSGAWLGRRALSVVTASHDGREPETALTASLLQALKLEKVADLIPWAAAATPADLASLCPAIFTAALTGDLRANSLVTLAAEELVLHARMLARQLFVDERASVPLALGGGLLSPGSLLRKRLLGRARTAVPGAVLHEAEVVPTRGAVWLARRALGVAPV